MGLHMSRLSNVRELDRQTDIQTDRQTHTHRDIQRQMRLKHYHDAFVGGKN